MSVKLKLLLSLLLSIRCLIEALLILFVILRELLVVAAFTCPVRSRIGMISTFLHLAFKASLMPLVEVINLAIELVISSW
jgi:hypothetical protein